MNLRISEFLPGRLYIARKGDKWAVWEWVRPQFGKLVCSSCKTEPGRTVHIHQSDDVIWSEFNEEEKGRLL